MSVILHGLQFVYYIYKEGLTVLQTAPTMREIDI